MDWRVKLLIFLLAVMPLGCGYHFTGSGSLPANASQIYIAMLTNRTAETGAESTFTNDLIYEFTRNRKSAIAASRQAADAILTGTIVSLAVENISRKDITTAVQRRVTGKVTLRLETPDGRILWSSGTIVERQAYNVVSGNKSATDHNKSEAIAELSKKLAETAFGRMTDDF